MLESLPREIRDGLDNARLRALRHKSRLRVQVGEEFHPILRFWDRGFSLDAKTAPHLRGLVDVYHGSRQIYQCLIIATDVDGDELICEFKRFTMTLDKAPVDFERDENAPVALLPRA